MHHNQPAHSQQPAAPASSPMHDEQTSAAHARRAARAVDAVIDATAGLLVLPAWAAAVAGWACWTAWHALTGAGR